jgi:hypothetical protein
MRIFLQSTTAVLARVILCSAFLTGSWFLPAHGAEPPFTIMLSAEHDTVKAGDDVWIKMIVTNSSDQIIHITHNAPVCEYEVQVRDAPDHMAPETDYGLQVKNRHKPTATGFVMRGGKVFLPPCMKGNERTGVLAPGKSDDATVLAVSELYDLSRPGQYTIQLRRGIPKDLGGGVVQSNIITVTVTK